MAPDTTFGHYRLISKIGAGGTGEVHRAHDSRLDREVAIKFAPHCFVAFTNCVSLPASRVAFDAELTAASCTGGDRNSIHQLSPPTTIRPIAASITMRALASGCDFCNVFDFIAAHISTVLSCLAEHSPRDERWLI